jgi:hypothetical protein
MLDVDNWLREHPRGSNPKARICGRYVSLLRYICNWKDQDCQPYEKIIIIAHSQGTVISADLLRFLHFPNPTAPEPYRWRDLDPQLEVLGTPRLPVYLFTMGCPLRQLYGLRFPFLYRWARHQNDDAMAPWRANDLASFNPRPAPEPDELGVKLWVNAYRSGDYIGRHLWRTDSCEYLWWAHVDGCSGPPPHEYHSTDGSPSRIEFCIGAGAHTHYWDETGQLITLELDRLIAS